MLIYAYLLNPEIRTATSRLRNLQPGHMRPKYLYILIRLRHLLKSATYRVIDISMKHFPQTTRQTQQIFAALTLTGILSVGVGMTLIKAAVADSVDNTQGITSLKQPRDRQLPRSVIDAVRREISRRTSTPPGQLRVVTFSQESWPDSCLGISRPDQACGQVYIQDGWRVVMSDGRQSWAYRTDGTGYIVRSEGEQTSPDSSNLPNSVSDAVLQAASQRTGLRTSELRIVNSVQIKADGCLGLPRPGEACIEIGQRVWEVTVEGGKQRLVYRTNRNGSQIRLNERASNITDAKLPQSIADAVLQVASKQLRVPRFQLRITKAQQETWTDGCLGLASPEEACLAALTPGWRVVVEGKQQVQTYRTDASGSRVRAEDLVAEPPRERNLPDSVAKAVLQDASRQSNLATSQLRIVAAEKRDWPNGCLGLAEPGIGCTRMIVPGWQVTVKGGQQSFVYRTNESGSLLKLEGAASQGNSGAVPIPKSELPPPLSEDVIFRAISSGGFIGQTYETTLLSNGRMIRKVITPNVTGSTPDITYISPEKLRQFKQMLERQPLTQFNGLSYPAPSGAADYITVTFSSRDGTTRYADMGQNRLPKELQEVIQAWNQIVRNR